MVLRHGWQRQLQRRVMGGGDSGGDGVVGGGGQRQRWRCVVGGGDSVGVASWAAETALASCHGWQRQRRQRRRGWRRAKTTSALHRGWRRQRWLCVVGGGDSIGITLWVAETTLALRRGWRRQRPRCIVGGGNSIGITSWVAETTLASHHGWRRQRRCRIMGGGDSIGVALWAAETMLTGSGGNSGEESGRWRRQGVAAAGPWRQAKSDNLLIVCCKVKQKHYP